MLSKLQGRVRSRAVAEHEVLASPRMRVGDGDIVVVARRNFEICVDANQSNRILKNMASFDVVKVGAGVDVTVVELRGWMSDVTADVVVAGNGMYVRKISEIL